MPLPHHDSTIPIVSGIHSSRHGIVWQDSPSLNYARLAMRKGSTPCTSPSGAILCGISPPQEQLETKVEYCQASAGETRGRFPCLIPNGTLPIPRSETCQCWYWGTRQGVLSGTLEVPVNLRMCSEGY
jgi:hypothetical protein